MNQQINQMYIEETIALRLRLKELEEEIQRLKAELMERERIVITPPPFNKCNECQGC